MMPNDDYHLAAKTRFSWGIAIMNDLLYVGSGVSVLLIYALYAAALRKV